MNDRTITGRLVTRELEWQNLPHLGEDGAQIKRMAFHRFECFNCNRKSEGGRSHVEAQMFANRDGWVKGIETITGEVHTFCPSCTHAAKDCVSLMNAFDAF